MKGLFHTAVAAVITLALVTVPVSSAQAAWHTGSPSLFDVMNVVYCVVGTGSCEGLEPGADLADTTSNGAVDAVACWPEAQLLAGKYWIVLSANDAPDSEGYQVLSYVGEQASLAEASDPGAGLEWETSSKPFSYGFEIVQI